MIGTYQNADVLGGILRHGVRGQSHAKLVGAKSGVIVVAGVRGVVPGSKLNARLLILVHLRVLGSTWLSPLKVYYCQYLVSNWRCPSHWERPLAEGGLA